MPAALFCPWPLPLLLICYLFQTLIVCMQSPFDDFSQLSPSLPVYFSQLSPSPLFCFLSFPPSLLFYSFLLSPSLSLLFAISSLSSFLFFSAISLSLSSFFSAISICFIINVINFSISVCVPAIAAWVAVVVAFRNFSLAFSGSYPFISLLIDSFCLMLSLINYTISI